MNKLLKSFGLLITGVLMVSCSSEINYADAVHTRLPMERKILYALGKPVKTGGKLLVIIPDDPDTNQTYYQGIAELFKRKDYDILIIGKPGEDNYKKRSLDSREERIEDVVSLLSVSDSLYNKELVLLGVGEGAYILPALASRLKPASIIFINSGVLSPLAELEYISGADSLTEANEKLLSLYGIDEMDMLRYKIENIKTEPFGAMQMAPASNRCWLSYYEVPLLNQLGGVTDPVYWFNYQDYPLISARGFELADKVLQGYKQVSYHSLKTVKKDGSMVEREILSTINKH